MSSVEIISQIKFPRANPVKMCKVYDPQGELMNIDDQRFGDIIVPGGLAQRFDQKWRITDTNIIQFYSTFLGHTAEVLNCEEAQKFYDGESYTAAKSLTVDQIKEYRNKFYRSDCRVVTVGDKIAVFFEDGYEYENSAFTELGDEFILNGALPSLTFPSTNLVGASVRVNIQYGPSTESGFLEANIIEISHIEGKECLILSLEIETIEVPGQIEILYNEKELDLYGFGMDWSGLSEGRYLIGFKALSGANEVRFLSEHQYVDLVRPENTELIKYWSTGEYREPDELGYLYEDGYLNKIRIDGTFTYMEVGGETEVYEDDRGINTDVRSVEFTQIRLSGDHLPGYMLRILSSILSHDFKEIREYRWEKSDFGSNEEIELTDFSNFEITLRQVDDVRFQKAATFSEIVSAEFDPDVLNMDENGTIGNNHTLVTNAQNTFELLSKPSWVNVSENELTNGEITVLSASENTDTTERSGTVIYRAINLPTLTAEIEVTQDAEEVVDSLVTSPADNSELIFNPSGSQIDITVNSSGPYAFGHVGLGFAVAQISANVLRVTALSNPTGVVKSGTLEVYLISDGTKRSDFVLTQEPLPFIESVSPENMSFLASGGSRTLEITSEVGCNWQITSSVTWLSFSSSGTGSAVRTIIALQNNGTSARYATLTIQNTSIPSNNFTVVVSQPGSSGGGGGGGGGPVPVPVEP